MIGYVLTKRVYRPYLIVPMFLYACVMYRMLEGLCKAEDIRNKEREAILNAQSPRVTLSDFQIDHADKNFTAELQRLMKEFRKIEHHRNHILSSLHQMIDKSATDRPENIAFVLRHLNKGNVKENIVSIAALNDESDRKPMSLDSGNLKLPINCENIHEVGLRTKIGHGVSKQTFSADFRGRRVAVKMVTRHQIEVKSCLEKLNQSDSDVNFRRAKCFVFSNMKLMKEILLLQQLDHPGFVRLLGYCVRSEESDTTDLNERGIVSVFELGSRIEIYQIQTLTWQEKLNHAMELADFLHYLEYSPLGSLRIRDFKTDHFVLVNGSLKMIDLDDVDNLEPSCAVYVNIEAQMEMIRNGTSVGCEFHLPCQKGLCVGFNARQNLMFMTKLFFKNLLFPTVFPQIIANEVGGILADLDSNILSAGSLIKRLKSIGLMPF